MDASTFVRGLLDQPEPRRQRNYAPFGVLPLREDDAGIHFDPNAGLLGAAISGATLPGDVLTGKVDPSTDEGFSRVQDLAGLLGGSGYATEKPAGAIGMFAGQKAKNANLTALADAYKLEVAGAGKPDIWGATGWFRGADKKWRFEIPDDTSSFHHLRMPQEPSRWEIAKQYFESQGVPATKIATGQYPLLDQEAFAYADHQISRGLKPQAPMATLLEHPQLYDNYGGAGALPVSAEASQNLNGSFSPATNAVTIARERSLVERPSEVAARQHSTALHELQHYIQSLEGFAPGANVAQFEGMYDHVPDAQAIRAIMNKRGVMPSDAIREFEGMVGRPVSMRSKDLASSITKDLWKIPSSAKQAYTWSAGEVEARNVQNRMNMTPDQRRNTPPWETEDVPIGLQIVQSRQGF